LYSSNPVRFAPFYGQLDVPICTPPWKRLRLGGIKDKKEESIGVAITPGRFYSHSKRLPSGTRQGLDGVVWTALSCGMKNAADDAFVKQILDHLRKLEAKTASERQVHTNGSAQIVTLSGKRLKLTFVMSVRSELSHKLQLLNGIPLTPPAISPNKRAAEAAFPNSMFLAAPQRFENWKLRRPWRGRTSCARRRASRG